MHFIAHQLRTWNKEESAKALALEIALGPLYRKRKLGKRSTWDTPPPYFTGLLSQPQVTEEGATQHSTNPGRVQQMNQKQSGAGHRK